MPNLFIPNPIHIRNVILFLFLSNVPNPEIEKRLTTVYPHHSTSHGTVHKWVTRFKNGDFNLEDQPRSGRPSELDTDALLSLLEADPYQSIRTMATSLHVGFGTVQEGLNRLGKVKKLGRWIPHRLTDFDKERRVDMALALVTSHRTFDWLNKLVTGDEKWVLYDNHHRRAQWVDREEQAADVPKPELHQKKVML